MTTRTRPQVPAGLAVEKNACGWFIRHLPSRLPIHPGYFATKRSAVDTLAAAPVFDWTGDSNTIRAAVVDRLGNLDRLRVVTQRVYEMGRTNSRADGD